MINIYNTLTGKKEIFIPIKKKYMSMYVCGITPYNEVHLGHARTYTIFDIIKRNFIRNGYTVNHVQNFTDIDDKIIKISKNKNITTYELTKNYIEKYFIQLDKLNVLKANKYIYVTQVISEIIDFIKSLINKKFAYETSDAVYFAVKKFNKYGELSKRNKNLNNLCSIINSKKYNKREELDFALWKKTESNEIKTNVWDSPWGKGRPGWHIECSVMVYLAFGKTIDIHGGGKDLIFPHHENEIAQSETNNEAQLAKYWVHSGLVTMSNEKMSKSTERFISLQSILDKYDPQIIRYYFLTQQYSKLLNFTEKSLSSAKNGLKSIEYAYKKITSFTKFSANEVIDKDLIKLQNNFFHAIDDNFNVVKALSYLHVLKNKSLKEIFSNIKSRERFSQLKKLFEDFSDLALGLNLPNNGLKIDFDLKLLFYKRNQARKNKNWNEADRLRRLINDKGYAISDNKNNNSILYKI
ncbi:MAG: cysteine--tRNA ligase [Endomicrobium sp.]|jgi:cysteinyl-tRNA synthetase|nr:cysteine--tRNA ligase [Endomicrobium sp.]